jgi:ribosomal protein L21E
MAREGGLRRKKRQIMRKHSRTKGKISIRKFLQTFKKGDKVALVTEPAHQRGVFNPRFSGKAGIIKAKKGKCYEVQIKDYKKEKCLIVHPIHLKRL